MHIERNAHKGTLCISQKNYIDGIINEFQAKEAIGKDTPAPADDIKETDAPKTEAEKQKLIPVLQIFFSSFDFLNDSKSKAYS